jgi:hypothetical protein
MHGRPQNRLDPRTSPPLRGHVWRSAVGSSSRQRLTVGRAPPPAWVASFRPRSERRRSAQPLPAVSSPRRSSPLARCGASAAIAFPRRRDRASQDPALSSSRELGLLLVFSGSCEGLDTVEPATRLDIGGRAGLALSLMSLASSWAPFLALHVEYFPRPYEFEVGPLGRIGSTNRLWVGASVGLSWQTGAARYSARQ